MTMDIDDSGNEFTEIGHRKNTLYRFINTALFLFDITEVRLWVDCYKGKESLTCR